MARLVVLMFLLCCIPCGAFAADSLELPISESQAIAMVKQAAKAIHAEATETFAKINAGEAPFKDKANPALYVFVYDTSVTMVAHPNKALVGKHLRGKPDVRGKLFRDELVKVALENGHGWVDYHYQKPGETTFYEKTTYCERVVGSNGKVYVIACGRYK